MRFLHLCQFYYNLSQDPDGPDEEIIMNDDALDRWVMKRRMDNKKERLLSKRDSETSGNVRKHSNKETFHVG